MTDQEFLTLVAMEQNERRSKLIDNRLVHYTSAEAAYQIICNRTVWMRNAAMMNDFSEIVHGIQCLHNAWTSPGGLALQTMLDRIRPGLREEIANFFDGHALGLREQTYIASLSEHACAEDELGRLSMWRAYGGKNGVALVLNVGAFAATTDAMKAYSAPVFYMSIQEFVAWFQNWAGRLLANESQLITVNPDAIRNILFTAFRSFALCTKHPGFKEEREWRVFNSPLHEGGSKWLEWCIEIVHGLPQSLIKLRLFDDENAGVVGVAPRSLINRVIIGPCQYPLQTREALFTALERAEVENYKEKVWMSLIPLRYT